ncbi:hypothetical protein K523DRAFT_343548 [Schizophyllum commune Tattone D]|nr:hypothetical protein K523DRAFT_343548 [Schizophyllum commune Tattone D]
MGHGLPPQLLRNARGKWFSARCRLRRNRIEALLTALASIDLFDVGMRAVYDLTSIFFFAYSISFLHLAMMPLPANSCDKDLPILNGAQYLVLFLLSGFVTVADLTTRASGQVSQPTPSRALRRGKINIFVNGVTAQGAGLKGRKQGTVIKISRGSNVLEAMQQLRRMHLVADLEKIKPVAYVFRPGVGQQYLAEKDEQEAIVLENNSTLHVRYRVLGGNPGPERSQSATSGDHRYRPTDFRPHQSFRSKDPRLWQNVAYGQWFCIPCDHIYSAGSIRRHESSQSHARAVGDWLAKETPPMSAPEFAQRSALDAGSRLASSQPPHHTEPDRQVVYERMRQRRGGGWDVDATSGQMDIDWTADGYQETADAYIPHNEQEIGALADNLVAYFDNDGLEGRTPSSTIDVDRNGGDEHMPDLVDSDDEDEEWDAAEKEDEEDPSDAIPTPTHPSRRRRRAFDNEANPWYPWPDKETCIIDVLRHIPRCAFSAKQNQVTHWAMSVLGVNDVPTDRSMKDIEKLLRSICGVESIRFISAFSNIYYTNDTAALIAQEMANPRVRRHLCFLPEKTSGRVSEAWQAARWLDELSSDFLTQMVRKEDDPSQDFYIYEPTLLANGKVFMPTRWYTENGDIHAKGWYLLADYRYGGYYVDQRTQACISEYDLHLSLPFFAQRHALLHLPSPHSILEYNVHFACTSNIASPLEMAEGIVSQIQQAQERGIWAYDEYEKTYVLSVFALLGDNPMQSELCSHSGIAANHFCRICWVEGADMDGDIDDDEGGRRSRSPSPSPSPASPGTAGPSQSTASGARTRAEETVEDMKARIECFMRVGGNRSVKASRTATGINDRYQGQFLDMLAELTTKRSRTKVQKEADVASLLSTLPDAFHMINPLCRLKELDGHADTPVEILHVILLGIVKYFWRDIIVHRLSNAKKDILKARLETFDVRGLGLSPLSGDALVDHAGSLVGGDFRAIVQVAPFVLHDLGIDEDILRVWMALGRVVPLVWQPEIDHMDEYLDALRDAIQYLLDCTCRFDAQWFNKPKFHLLLHLPEHIRRFGPAMLFATEGFESFNAIVRARSIHSNRHAPSCDIARSMARGNRIRHLISSGFFRVFRESPSLDASSNSRPAHTPSSNPPPLPAGPSPPSITPSGDRTGSFAAKFFALANDGSVVIRASPSAGPAPKRRSA